MLDGQGRDIRYLRVSVTDRCNLRCRYCMPEEGVERREHGDILSYEQIARVVRLAAGLGIDKVRLTGGEPLVRRGVDGLVRMLKETEGIRTVALTTNGVGLKEQLPGLLEAGLDGVNISLDTLDREQFARITRRDALSGALAGLEAALGAEGLEVKVNCVPMGENDDQLVPLAELARDRRVAVRFIELMPIGMGRSMERRTEARVLEILEREFGPARSVETGRGDGPAHYVSFEGFVGKVGFISSLSHRFCGGCNRVRLTSTGFLKTCLQFEKGVDLKALLDGGAGDDVISEAMERAILAKPLGHHFAAPEREGDEKRNMNEIGG